MKKLNLLLVFFLSLVVCVPNVNAQSRAMKRALKKEYKAKMKEYKKDGWKVYGTSRSLDVALLKHYEKINEEGAFEVMGVASSFISKNIGQQAALNSACSYYASLAESQIRGRMISDIFKTSEKVPEEFDKFYAAYESKVEKEIRGELQPSYSVIRSMGKDTAGQEIFEMRSFFVINQDAALQARLRAIKNALTESEAAQQYADKVSEFVQEAFKVDQ